MTIGFENTQWRVEDKAIVCTDDGLPYYVDLSRLHETTSRPNGLFYDWPVHMAEKTWIDIEAFLEAFNAALETVPGDVDRTMLDRSCLEARRIAHETRQSVAREMGRVGC